MSGATRFPSSSASARSRTMTTRTSATLSRSRSSPRRLGLPTPIPAVVCSGACRRHRAHAGRGAWSYDDLGALVAERLQVDVRASGAGSIRREARLRCGRSTMLPRTVRTSGSTHVVLVAGTHACMTRAQRAGVDVPWTPPGGRPSFPVFSADLRRASAIGFSRALNCFPLYEHGLARTRGSLPRGRRRGVGPMWAGLARRGRQSVRVDPLRR